MKQTSIRSINVCITYIIVVFSFVLKSKSQINEPFKQIKVIMTRAIILETLIKVWKTENGETIIMRLSLSNMKPLANERMESTSEHTFYLRCWCRFFLALMTKTIKRR
jgi:hypothetical protein